MSASERAKPKSLREVLNTYGQAVAAYSKLGPADMRLEGEDLYDMHAAVEAWALDALVRAWHEGRRADRERVYFADEAEAAVRAIIEGRDV